MRVVHIVMATDRGKIKRVRFTFEVDFKSEVAKESFVEKLTAVRDLLTLRGAPKQLTKTSICSRAA